MDKITPEPVANISRLVGAVVGLEAAMMGFIAGIYAYYAVADGGQQRSAQVALAVSALVVSVLLGLLARGAWRGRTWPRGGIFTWQLLQAAVGVAVFGDRPWLGIALIVPAVVVSVAIVKWMNATASSPS